MWSPSVIDFRPLSVTATRIGILLLDSNFWKKIQLHCREKLQKWHRTLISYDEILKFQYLNFKIPIIFKDLPVLTDVHVISSFSLSGFCGDSQHCLPSMLRDPHLCPTTHGTHSKEITSLLSVYRFISCNHVLNHKV